MADYDFSLVVGPPEPTSNALMVEQLCLTPSKTMTARLCR